MVYCLLKFPRRKLAVHWQHIGFTLEASRPPLDRIGGTRIYGGTVLEEAMAFVPLEFDSRCFVLLNTSSRCTMILTTLLSEFEFQNHVVALQIWSYVRLVCG